MTILQSLASFYERLERRGDYVPQPGYAPVRIAFVLEIDRDGMPRALIDMRDVSQRRPVAPAVMMPAVSRTSGVKPAFLWDKTAYVFGVTAIEEGTEAGKRLIAGQGRRTLEEHEAFRRAHFDMLAESRDEGLVALRCFVERWRPEQWAALGFASEALDENIAFRLLGDDRRIDEREAARELVRSKAVSNSQSAPCLITGRVAPYAVLQPQLKGVQGAQSSGAPLVSFNADAFESYGKEDGANAPVSEEAAFRYGAALNWLLDRSNSRSFRLGETTVVFWADEKSVDANSREVGEQSAVAAETEFWKEFGITPAVSEKGEDESVETEADDDFWGGANKEFERDTDAESKDAIRTTLTNVQNLRPIPPDISALRPETRLYILGLSPNSGRIAVRFWLVDTYGHLEENLKRYKNDIAILPLGPYSHQKAYALLYETAVQRKAENIPPRLGGELARAILTGSSYPRTLFTSVIGRMRADKVVNAARAGICKAVINRDNDREVIPMALNPESDDEAYNLGRLFAVYEYAERQVADRNATIRDKYIGAASATPRRVFPILMRGYEHNASALAKGEGNQRGSGIKAAKAVTQILERFGGDMPFPTALTLEAQGRFFVGYYHQNAALYTRADRGADVQQTEGAST
jgi:CRISPR-associated protein Csd1